MHKISQKGYLKIIQKSRIILSSVLSIYLLDQYISNHRKSLFKMIKIPGQVVPKRDAKACFTPIHARCRTVVKYIGLLLAD